MLIAGKTGFCVSGIPRDFQTGFQMANAGLLARACFKDATGEAKGMEKPFETAPGSTAGSAKPQECQEGAEGAAACAGTTAVGSTGWQGQHPGRFLCYEESSRDEMHKPFSGTAGGYPGGLCWSRLLHTEVCLYLGGSFTSFKSDKSCSKVLMATLRLSPA